MSFCLQRDVITPADGYDKQTGINISNARNQATGDNQRKMARRIVKCLLAVAVASDSVAFSPAL